MFPKALGKSHSKQECPKFHGCVASSVTDVSSRTLRRDNSGAPQHCFSADLQVQASGRSGQQEVWNSERLQFEARRGDLWFSKSDVVCDKFSQFDLDPL